MSLEFIVKQNSETYPGFPPFVHHIMAMNELGNDPPTIIEKMKEYKILDEINKLLNTINSTHITYEGNEGYNKLSPIIDDNLLLTDGVSSGH
jgi:hypothetical protein